MNAAKADSAGHGYIQPVVHDTVLSGGLLLQKRAGQWPGGAPSCLKLTPPAGGSHPNYGSGST